MKGRVSMFATVAHRFTALLEEDPFAPALVLTRTGSRDRIWVRAAVEHRAVRIAGACAKRAVPFQARVAFTGHGTLDRLAASLFVLATGRILVDSPDADFVIDDEICRESEVSASPAYVLRCVTRSSDHAAVVTGLLTHGELYRVAIGGRLPDSDFGRAIESLALGVPVQVQGDQAVELRPLVYAA